MNSVWTKEDIAAILVQLNSKKLPFSKYEFAVNQDELVLLGSGASANVYEAVRRGRSKEKAAIKVIGFGDRYADSDTFNQAVAAQKDIGTDKNNIVKIYDSIELYVWIEGEHDVIRVENASEPSESEGNCLKLQFILMEELSPIYTTNRISHKLIPRKLARFEEKEIIKLAYDVGTAVNCAHKKGLIHRDIKPENIFYDIESGSYKLGDFGIAKTTNNGLASTIAFTKGYGAPEVVGTLEDKYDCTADIYSFGMMLYVLLNELKFPGSENYHPNVYQYTQGYVPPNPINGSEELTHVVKKMISFSPDDRYQTMEEVLNELDKLRYGREVKYKREHMNSTLVLGVTLALIGSVMWKFTFMPVMEVRFSVIAYILCALCVFKGLLKLFNKNTFLISVFILGTGIGWTIASGYAWWKVVALIYLALLGNYFIGVVGGGAILANISYLVMSERMLLVEDFSSYRWITVLLLMLSVLMLFMNGLAGDRDALLTKLLLRRNILTMIWTACFAAMIIIGNTSVIGINKYLPWIGDFVADQFKWMHTWSPVNVGIYGICFCAFWTVREYLLIYIEKRVERKYYYIEE